jgi:hypothetical protein
MISRPLTIPKQSTKMSVRLSCALNAWRLICFWLCEYTDSVLFDDFMKQLLHYHRPFPKRDLILIVDGASVYHSNGIEEMCRNTSVIFIYLLPYSLDLKLV